MSEETKFSQQQPQDKQACDVNISRKEFLASLVQRATIAGTLLAAPKIIDQFLVPPAYAASSTNPTADTGSNDTAGGDTKTGDTGSSDTAGSDTKHSVDCTSPFHDNIGSNPFHDLNTSPFHDCVQQ